MIFDSEAYWLKVYEHKSNWRALAHVFLLISLIPVSNAIVERHFSKLKLIKTDLRNQMTVPRLS